MIQSDKIIETDTEFDFWDRVLSFLNTFSKKHITNKERELLCYAMMSDSKTPFAGMPGEKIRKAVDMITTTFNMHKSNLRQKGWIVGTELHPSMTSLRDYIRNSGVYSFTVPLSITWKRNV